MSIHMSESRKGMKDKDVIDKASSSVPFPSPLTSSPAK